MSKPSRSTQGEGSSSEGTLRMVRILRSDVDKLRGDIDEHKIRQASANGMAGDVSAALTAATNLVGDLTGALAVVCALFARRLPPDEGRAFIADLDEASRSVAEKRPGLADILRFTAERARDPNATGDRPISSTQMRIPTEGP